MELSFEKLDFFTEHFGGGHGTTIVFVMVTIWASIIGAMLLFSLKAVTTGFRFLCTRIILKIFGLIEEKAVELLLLVSASLLGLADYLDWLR